MISIFVGWAGKMELIVVKHEIRDFFPVHVKYL